MYATIEEMKEEAIWRMKHLHLAEDVIRDFEKEERELNLSLYGEIFGLSAMQKEKVRNFEETTGTLAYHLILDTLEFGDLLTFLYVSNRPDEWGMEREDLAALRPIAYVYNVESPNCSEFGTVEIRPNKGALVRVF